MHLDQEDWDGIDLPEADTVPTQYFHDRPKNVINRVKSSDIPLEYSVNPHQGCEHGCIYCYARNTHQYYGFSAGLDFESKIVAKENVAEVLEKKMRSLFQLAKKKHFQGRSMPPYNLQAFRPAGGKQLGLF